MAEVSPDDLDAHARRVEAIAVDLQDARDLGAAARLGPGSYGPLCTAVPVLLAALQDKILEGTAGAVDSLRAAASRLHAAAGEYRGAEPAWALRGPGRLPRAVPGVTVDPWAGVWIAEDIDHIADRVRGGDWIDPVLRDLVPAAAPDGDLAVAATAWVVERIEPFRRVLDRLDGDATQTAAHARTWRTVAGRLRDRAHDLDRAVRFDVAYWGGAAGSAYRASSQQRHDVIDGLARSAGTLALIAESAGALVGGVRARVRAEVLGLEVGLAALSGGAAWGGAASGGAAGGAPADGAVAGAPSGPGTAALKNLSEVNRIVTALTARVAGLLRALVASLRWLRPLIERVDRCVEALKDLLRRADHTHAAPEDDPPKKPLDPEDEAMRVHDLGVDPAVARYRPNEAQTAALVEIQLGVTLQRAAPGEPADWVDERGRTYDAVGPFPARYFARQWAQLRYQINRHLDKADLVPVDVSEFTADQTARVKRHITDNNLGPRIFLVGQ